MRTVDCPGPAGAAIDLGPSAGPELSISDLVLRRSADERIATVPNVELAPADRLLVGGPSGTGKSTLMRALAGIWPLGDGRIRLPQAPGIEAIDRERPCSDSTRPARLR